MADGSTHDTGIASVFHLENANAWRRWRDRKLANAPRTASDLIVEIDDPRKLKDSERDAIVARCRRANMAVYASRAFEDDPAIVRYLGAQLGLRTLDANLLSEADGVTRIAVTRGKASAGYIPYTDRRLLWHTDGYYNPPPLRIRSMLLHCVRPAVRGGETALLDHELAWLLLRETDPRLVEALMLPDALTIPERREGDRVARRAVTGPVFSIDADGDLHMRFTARRHNVEWKRDATVSEAAARLVNLLDRDTSHVLRLRLEPGMGLACNNVLHERSAFEDDPAAPRLFFRARYAERIAGTAGAWSRLTD